MCAACMDLSPDTWSCGLCMRRECRESFPLHRLGRKPLVSDPDMHHSTCVMHMSSWMWGSLTRGGIPGACTTRSFYLVRGPKVTPTRQYGLPLHHPSHFYVSLFDIWNMKTKSNATVRFLKGWFEFTRSADNETKLTCIKRYITFPNNFVVGTGLNAELNMQHTFIESGSRTMIQA